MLYPFNEARKKAQVYEHIIVTNPDKILMHLSARLDAFCKLEGGRGIEIGAFVHIASFCHLNIGGGLLIIEEGATCSSGVKICTGMSVVGVGLSGSAAHPNFQKKTATVYIRRNATIFAGAIILPGVEVGAGAVVAAGAVVTKSVRANTQVQGVPAREVMSW